MKFLDATDAYFKECKKRWEILNQVSLERDRQEGKWGEQNHQPEKWLAILGEEFGEVCRAVCEHDGDNYREELIQVAAVAVSMVECYDRNSKKTS